jgi:hypothetical protein
MSRKRERFPQNVYFSVKFLQNPLNDRFRAFRERTGKTTEFNNGKGSARIANQNTGIEIARKQERIRRFETTTQKTVVNAETARGTVTIPEKKKIVKTNEHQQEADHSNNDQYPRNGFEILENKPSNRLVPFQQADRNTGFHLLVEITLAFPESSHAEDACKSLFGHLAMRSRKKTQNAKNNQGNNTENHSKNRNPFKMLSKQKVQKRGFKRLVKNQGKND